MTIKKRNRELRDRAKRHGANYALAIIEEARRNKIPVSLGFALIEQESGFRNVWGGDRAPNGKTTGLQFKPVSKARYLQYKRARGSRGQGGMQGVGPAQLTWWEFQDSADQLGGCWIARNNIRFGFRRLAELVRHHGTRKALAIYNGGVGNPQFGYADSVLARQRKWHRILT